MLPNLIIIGAAKCGTTSLHYYLSLHPDITMSRQKELDFFIEKYNWHRGIDWYQSHFKGKAKIYGESSPNYTNYPRSPEVPGRMHEIVPDAKLIYLVRDPIERMISHYIHKCKDGLEDRPIEEALVDEQTKSYLHRSLYYTQLEKFLTYYSISQILVMTAEDLRQETGKTLERIFEFLGVDTNFHTWQYAIERHKSDRKRRKTAFGNWLAKTSPARVLEHLPQPWQGLTEDVLYFPFSHPIERPQLDRALRQELSDRLREDIDRLRNFSGCDFKQWSV